MKILSAIIITSLFISSALAGLSGDITKSTDEIRQIDLKKDESVTVKVCGLTPISIFLDQDKKATDLDSVSIDSKQHFEPSLIAIDGKTKGVTVYHKKEGGKTTLRLIAAGKIHLVNVESRICKNSETSIKELHINIDDPQSLSAKLTPDMKIPGELLNMILVSDDNIDQVVRIKVLENVRDPSTSEIVIPKGSIVVGKTTGFEPDTGIMDIDADKVSVGSGEIIHAKFSVGSADATIGLKGNVLDSEGKYLLGASVTSYTAGALNWFNPSITKMKSYTSDFSVSERKNLIHNVFPDERGEHRYDFVPRGIPLVLFPEE